MALQGGSPAQPAHPLRRLFQSSRAAAGFLNCTAIADVLHRVAELWRPAFSHPILYGTCRHGFACTVRAREDFTKAVVTGEPREEVGMIFRQRAQPVLKQGLACKQECRGWRGLRRKSRSETSCRWSDRSGPTAYNETDAAPRTSETLTRLSFLRSLAAVRGRSCASPRSSGGGGGTPEPSLRLHHFAGGRRGSERS